MPGVNDAFSEVSTRNGRAIPVSEQKKKAPHLQGLKQVHDIEKAEVFSYPRLRSASACA